MAEQANRGIERSDIVTKKGKTFGAFFWCVPSENTRSFRYAYTYGEPDFDTAKNKAAYAFDAEGGNCVKTPVLITINSDQL